MTNEQIQQYTIKRRRNRLIMAALIFAGFGINYLLFTMVSNLNLPLYLDNVGSILAAVLGGYIPGILAGFMTNIVNCLTDPTSIYYGIITVLIAAVSAFFESKGWLTIRKPLKVLLYVLILTLLGGGLGTLLPWLLDGLSFESESFGSALRDAGLRNQMVSQLFGNLLMDALDKAITTAIVLIVKALIPEKIKEKLRFDGMLQAPLDKETSDEVKAVRCRVISVRTKIMSLIITALVLLGTVATAISFVLFNNVSIEQQKKLVNGVANVAAGIVDGDRIDEFLEKGAAAPDYAETEKRLYDLRSSDDDIRFIFVYRIQPDGGHVVFDLEDPDVPAGKPGDIVTLDSYIKPYEFALIEGEEIEPIISDEKEFGWLLTVYKPILDSSGKVVAHAAAEVSMYEIGDYQRNFIAGMISLYLLFFVVIFAVVLWVVEHHIVTPVNSMSMVVSKFAYTSDDAQLNANVDKIAGLGIRTGDEIENLYNAVVEMGTTSVRQVEDIRHKNETIAKMQNALILVLADLVESRDKNTGDHVRKTAAYTRIIMRKMREMGFYADELTDEFVENVGNIAPMHDIGKIKVSDAILNKPGRLTDDEFLIMQAHATYGRDIIEQVIAFVPESDYMQEAKNVSYYHHEKWNGKGYPTGLRGEEIPLSARIMAVADVFDALVSKRSYKAPFSYEQACDIIREGAGVHFDPLVAEAFLAAGDEVRKVAESFGELSRDYVKDEHVDDSGKSR